MPLVGVIAANLWGKPSLALPFATSGNSPVIGGLSGVGKGWSTNNKIYYFIGRGGSTYGDTAQNTNVYSRTTSATTWTSEGSLGGNYGQWKFNLFPVGSSNKWILGTGEYGGGQTYVDSYTGSGAWTSETAYPVSTAYQGSGTIGTTGYVFAGYNNSTNISSAYSYTGSGSWIAQTNYPYTCGFWAYSTELRSTNRVYGLGGRPAGTSTNATLVYSYSGSGSWQAETNLPARSDTGSAMTASSPNAIYILDGNSGTGLGSTIYSYTGSGAWKVEGTHNMSLGGQSAPIVAYAANNLFVFGNTYNGSTTNVYKVTVNY